MRLMSWVTYDGHLYYLTANILNCREGRELMRREGEHFLTDSQGHGIILEFYGLPHVQKNHHVCHDFTSPENFPLEIAESLRRGSQAGIGLPPPDQYDNLLVPGLPAWERARREIEVTRATQEAAAAFCREAPHPSREYYDRYRVFSERRREHNTALVRASETFWSLFRDPRNRAPAWR